jgi:hypothetical protein
MTTDWWDMYGSSQARADEGTRQCWDCNQACRTDMMSPDGVRCVDCWRSRRQPDFRRGQPGSRDRSRHSRPRSRRPARVSA